MRVAVIEKMNCPSIILSKAILPKVWGILHFLFFNGVTPFSNPNKFNLEIFNLEVFL